MPNNASETTMKNIKNVNIKPEKKKQQKTTRTLMTRTTSKFSEHTFTAILIHILKESIIA